MPVKMLYRLTASVIGVAGVTGAVSSSSAIMSGTATIGIPTVAGTDGPRYVVGGGQPPGVLDQDTASDVQPDEDSMVEKIGKIIDESRDAHGMSSGVDQEVPRNTKKRMWEENIAATKKDEL
jgi:hypothetical protein